MTGERVVWKYPFQPGEDRLDVDVPVGSRVVLFAFQASGLAVWLEHPVDLEHLPQEERTFLIRGTGQPTPEGPWAHRGSAMTDGGAFVFHLYERSSS